METSLQSSPPTARRQTYLRLASEIESQLRDAYDRRFVAGEATQSSLAKALDIDRSAIHRRLMGHTNMTIETIADMVWALGCKIAVKISDVNDAEQNHPIENDAKESKPKIESKPSSGTIDLGKRKPYEMTL